MAVPRIICAFGDSLFLKTALIIDNRGAVLIKKWSSFSLLFFFSETFVFLCLYFRNTTREFDIYYFYQLFFDIRGA